MRFRRYQLNKQAARALESGHPWIFRGNVSSAAEVFADGDKLRLVGGDNRVLGHGVYQAEGAVAIRILSRGERAPDAAWVAHRVGRALERRRQLRESVGAYRALHGESDGLPGVVLDVYASTGVLQSYSAGVDAIARHAAAHAARALGLTSVLWKPALRRRSGGPDAPRVLRGPAPGTITFREGALELTVEPMSGQKSGAFLDLRGLRRRVAELDLAGARVLNLFSYTGTLGLAAEIAGAAEIWNVDASQPALAFAAAHHARDPARHRYVAADVFDWLPRLDRAESFDLVIADPPLMTSRRTDVPGALAAYGRLYRGIRRHVCAGGWIAACCCTSRIEPGAFRRCVDRALGPSFRFVERLPAEPDHPVAFAEADYLKLLLYREVTTPRSELPEPSERSQDS